MWSKKSHEKQFLKYKPPQIEKEDSRIPINRNNDRDNNSDMEGNREANEMETKRMRETSEGSERWFVSPHPHPTPRIKMKIGAYTERLIIESGKTARESNDQSLHNRIQTNETENITHGNPQKRQNNKHLNS